MCYLYRVGFTLQVTLSIFVMKMKTSWGVGAVGRALADRDEDHRV